MKTLPSKILKRIAAPPANTSLCRSAAAVALATLAMAATSSAQILTEPVANRVISWNLDNNGTINPTDLAGLAPAFNWNNSWPSDPRIGLVDNSGAATTLDLGYGSFNTWRVQGFHPGYDANGTANRELLNGYLNSGPAAWGPPVTNTFVAFTNIPYARYDVIIYFNSDASGRRATIDNGTTTYHFSTVGSPAISGANALFLPTAETDPSRFPAANFAFFAGMTNSSAVFNELPKSGNDQWLGIAGFQVIESSNVYVVHGPAPSAQTVALGQAASFKVIAGGSDARYQWRHNGSAIADATNAVYSIGSTVSGQNGDYDVVVSNSFSAATSSVATLTFYTPRTLRWTGAGSDWDTNSPNWTANNGSSTTAYVESDIVRFDPLGAGQPFVNLTGVRMPSAMVVSNADYAFSGGQIEGNGALNVANNGTLVLGSIDNRTGPTTIANGSAIEVGAGGVLGSGALTNNGGLVFNTQNELAYGYPIHGAGSITNRGPSLITLGGSVTGNYLVQEGAGSLLIQGDNHFTGGLIVQGGVATARSEGAFGGGSTVVSGGELQIPFTFRFTDSSLTLAGGTLNSGGSSIFEGAVSLAADAVINVAGGNTLTLSNAAGINGSGFIVTKVGDGTLALAGVTNRWAGLTITAGAVRIGAGGAAGGLGAGFVQADGAIEFNLSGNITAANDITGGGSINQIGAGTTTLTGDQSGFFGSVNVSNGVLRLNTSSSPATVAVAGGALGGTGTINSVVDVLPGGAIAPGAGVGTLTINGSLNLAGGVRIDVDRSLSQSNDVIAVNGTLINTGTGAVIVNNAGPALAAGNSFQVFNQPLAGGELLSVSGAGVTWSNRLAIDGTISVVSVSVPQPRITSTYASGGSLIVSGTNGAAGGSYQVLSSTNLALPLASWSLTGSGTFGGNGAFSVTNSINIGEPQRFYLLRLQ